MSIAIYNSQYIFNKRLRYIEALQTGKLINIVD